MSYSSAILFADMQFFAKVEARIIIASYQLGHEPTRILILITGAELRRTQLNRIGRAHVKGAAMAVAKRSC